MNFSTSCGMFCEIYDDMFDDIYNNFFSDFYLTNNTNTHMHYLINNALHDIYLINNIYAYIDRNCILPILLVCKDWYIGWKKITNETNNNHNIIRIIQLNNLPSELCKLYCFGNELTQLNNLPNSLTELICHYNKINLNELKKMRPDIKYKCHKFV